VHLFNSSPRRTVEQLCHLRTPHLGVIPATNDELALWFITCDRLSKKQIGEFLGKRDASSAAVLDALLARLDFAPLTFDEALRFLLSLFKLPGEGQIIDRILDKFGGAYYAAHPTLFTSADTCHVLAYSTIMLNVDAHSEQIRNKMTLEQFVSNNRGIDNGKDLPRPMLEQLFSDISRFEIRLEQREFIGNTAKEGWLYKQGGGFKSWKRRYLILSGSVLYYFKAPKAPEPLGLIPLESVHARYCGEATIELTPASGAVIKSVKFKNASNSGAPAPLGRHTSFIFRADTELEARAWVDAMREHIVGTARGEQPQPRSISRTCACCLGKPKGADTLN